MSPPNRILWTGESAGLCEVYLLKQAISEAGINGLFTQILQRYLRFSTNIFQFYLSRHIEAQRLYYHTQDETKNLRWETDNLK